MDTNTGASVASLTFEVGAPSDFDDGTSSATALEAGSYTIEIVFDPASGTATADISALQTSIVEVAAGFDPGSVAGTWQMVCDASNEAAVLTACQNFLEEDPNTPFSIYFDVIRATIGGSTFHAMGVWESRATFILAGATEGIEPVSIPAGAVVDSLNTDVTGATAMGAFNGFTAAGGNYNGAGAASPHSMSGGNVVAFLDANGIPYDPSFDDPWMGPCDAGTSPLLLTNGSHRACLVDYLDELSYIREMGTLPTGGDAVVALMPRPAGMAIDSFAFPEDGSGNPLAVDGTRLIPFSTTQIADTAEIGGRFALMDFEISGNTGIATQFETFSYTGFDPMLMQEVSCSGSFELSIIFEVIDADNMAGRFTMAEADSCAPPEDARHNAFLVTFTRPGA